MTLQAISKGFEYYKKFGMNFTDISSYERKRIAGKKKVNEFKDGLKILNYMIKSFLK